MTIVVLPSLCLCCFSDIERRDFYGRTPLSSNRYHLDRGFKDENKGEEVVGFCFYTDPGKCLLWGLQPVFWSIVSKYYIVLNRDIYIIGLNK